MSAPYANTYLPPGTVVSRYRIDRKLAAGGFGAVYVATRNDGEVVAIKEFLPTILDIRRPSDGVDIVIRHVGSHRRFQNGLAAFFHEADVLARFRDPRVIAVWDVFKANGTGYFAMPLEKGCTLQTAIRRNTRPFSDQGACRVFLEAARGVESLHRAGLFHLDIKPSNLWLRPNGEVVVLDLGASRWHDNEGQGSPMARTPGFAAPEQHGVGPKTVDHLTDVYGLAASLYACLEGSPPRPAPQRRPDDTPLSKARMGQRDMALLSIVDMGMALRPVDRFQTVTAFKQALLGVYRLRRRSFLRLHDSRPSQPSRPRPLTLPTSLPA